METDDTPHSPGGYEKLFLEKTLLWLSSKYENNLREKGLGSCGG